MQPAGERDITPIALEQGSPSSASERDGPSISVETLAWGGLILAAGLLRFADLDGLPFSVDEASRSIDAVRVADGDVPETWRGELWAAATSYLFRIFGQTEFVARTVPAIAGLALVVALWWTRPHIGRTGALVAAIFVTFSPLFVLHARTANSYAVGPLLSVIVVVSLFEYLRQPRTAAAFPLIVSLALAPLTDAPAVLLDLVVLVFVGLEAIVFGNRDSRRAWQVFWSSPVQWISTLMVLAAALQLGITQFGTSVDAGLPGLRLATELFDLPRDSRPADYHLTLLFAYEWPLLLAGAAGLALLVVRFASKQGLAPFERFLLVWTLIASVALTLATRREAGQVLILLLPLALLTGRLAQELTAGLDWAVVRRMWPVTTALASIVALAALLMTQWSSGNASESERVVLAAAPVACVTLLAATSLRSWAGARVVAATVSAVVALAFMAHSSLAVAFGDGVEFAVDERLTPRVEQLKDRLDRLSVERNSEVTVDADLRDELGWTLRDSRVVFGGDPGDASILVTRPGAAPSFAELPDTYRLVETWYPDEVLAPRRMWRWLLYREPFGAIEFVELRIYVRTI